MSGTVIEMNALMTEIEIGKAKEMLDLFESVVSGTLGGLGI